MGLTVTRQKALNLTVKKGNFLTVNHQTQVKINRKNSFKVLQISLRSTLDNSNHQGKSKTEFELSGVRSNITRSKEIDGGGMCESEKQLFHLPTSVETGFAFTKG